MCKWMLICKLSRKKQKRGKTKVEIGFRQCYSEYGQWSPAAALCVCERLCVCFQHHTGSKCPHKNNKTRKMVKKEALVCNCFPITLFLSPTYKYISVGNSLIAVCMEGLVHSILCPVVFSAEMWTALHYNNDFFFFHIINNKSSLKDI